MNTTPENNQCPVDHAGTPDRKRRPKFNLSVAIERTLGGEPLASIYHVEPVPFLEATDYLATLLLKNDAPHLEKGKAILNVIRGAATISIKCELETMSINSPLLPLDERMDIDILSMLRERVQIIREHIKNVSAKLVNNPDPNSIFEQIIAALSPYSKTSNEEVRRKTLIRISHETFFRLFTPEFFEVVWEVWLRDFVNFPDQLERVRQNKSFTIRDFLELALNSQNIVLYGLNHGGAQLHAYLKLVRTGSLTTLALSTPQKLKAGKFKLFKTMGENGQFYVRGVNDIQSQVVAVQEFAVETEGYHSLDTGCVALARDRHSDAPKIINGRRQPQNLMEQIIYMSLFAD